MKNYLFLLAFSLLLFGCKKDSKEEVLPELNVRVEEYGRVYITNVDFKAVKFSIDYGDGRVVSDFIEKFPLYNEYKYSENITYTLLLTTWDIKNNKTIFSKTVSINNIPPKPVADFTVVLLDNGRVQCQNLSKNASSFEWYVNGYKSTTNNPIFIFEKNGEHEILLRTSSVDDIVSSKNITIKITNANEPAEIAEFNGQYFDKKGRFLGTNFNDFYGSRGLIALPNLVPSCLFGASGIDVNIVYFNGKPEYENLKNIFVIGNKNIYGKNKKYTDTDWYFAFQNYTRFLSDAMTSSLEIIDVKETNQPKLIPEMYDKAFWVTFKIKADFGNGNNIDGTLRVRYLIY